MRICIILIRIGIRIQRFTLMRIRPLLLIGTGRRQNQDMSQVHNHRKTKCEIFTFAREEDRQRTKHTGGKYGPIGQYHMQGLSVALAVQSIKGKPVTRGHKLDQNHCWGSALVLMRIKIHHFRSMRIRIQFRIHGFDDQN
jgi:hypothetical protein